MIWIISPTFRLWIRSLPLNQAILVLCCTHLNINISYSMMTSWHGKAFRITLETGGVSSLLNKQSSCRWVETYLTYTLLLCGNISLYTLQMLWTNDLYRVSRIPVYAQRQLDRLSRFCDPNQMLANEIKTKYSVWGGETFLTKARR